jgi:hypothetical protein
MNIKSKSYLIILLTIHLICDVKSQNAQMPKTFETIYPVLKSNLLKAVCESYKIVEERNTLKALSKETDMLLSSWEWDLKNSPLVAKDIDNDGLMDYTIELFNTGGGCGGQIGKEERWTLFGSSPNEFICTHVIPYRSATGDWQKVQKNKLYEIDFKDPQSVVNAIFYAAQTRDFAVLRCLCDPYGKADGDTKELCSISQVAEQIEDYGGSENTKKILDGFVATFESGRISGQVTYEDYEVTQFAKVPFLFNHPGGENRRDETMKLVKRHGNWYLSSF